MKHTSFFKYVITACCLILLSSFLVIPPRDSSAQIFSCTVRRDVEIPYQFEFFKTKILASTAFEIKFTIRDNTENKVYVRLIPGSHDPSVIVDDKTLTYYLGSNLYGPTKTDYEIIGSADDDVELPGISELFFQAGALDGDWVYDFDGGNARITDITLSSDQARFKYLEFWDNEFRDANMHADSQDFENYADLDEAEWEHLTPNTGSPVILDADEALYLNSYIPSSYIPPSYPYYYDQFFPRNFSSVFYGNYPFFGSYPGIYQNYYPGGFFSGYPSGPYNYTGSFPRWPGSSYYPASFPGSYFGSYLGSGSYLGGRYPFSFPGTSFGGYYGAFLGLRSMQPTYGVGIPPYGRFLY